jgi:hypothetical protein
VLHSQISLPTPPPCFFSTGVWTQGLHLEPLHHVFSQ